MQIYNKMFIPGVKYLLCLTFYTNILLYFTNPYYILLCLCICMLLYLHFTIYLLCFIVFDIKNISLYFTTFDNNCIIFIIFVLVLLCLTIMCI